MTRYRFGDYVLSPRRRLLVRGAAEQPLIPRYFDLLVFLIEHRHEAVHRRDIFDRVWNDVIVSDSALSQAIRTIRRTLDDDPRDPRYIRTVSRHGYRFVFDAVLEEDDDGTWPIAADTPLRQGDGAHAETDQFDALLQRLTDASADDEERRDAAERLHQLGTSEALARLNHRPEHWRARAILRDSRWDVPGSGPVPIAGTPQAWRASLTLVGLRLRRAARIGAGRTIAASIGGGTAGLLAGAFGGWLLSVVPGGTAPLALAGVLAAIGGACGALGGAGVGAGIAAAESTARSQRTAGLVIGAALGGALVGGLTQWLGRWTLSTLVGLDVPITGCLEGLAIGGAVGLGYALATRHVEGGLAAPRGRARGRAVGLVAAFSAAAALALTLAGRPLVGGTIHEIAQSSAHSQAALTSLGRLVGEPDFGPVSGALLGTGEGAIFGAGLAFGLTRRRRG